MIITLSSKEKKETGFQIGNSKCKKAKKHKHLTAQRIKYLLATLFLFRTTDSRNSWNFLPGRAVVDIENTTFIVAYLGNSYSFKENIVLRPNH